MRTIKWDGNSFTPQTAQDLMSAIAVSEAADVSGTRVPETKSKGWMFTCPDCDKDDFFFVGMPHDHKC